MTEENSVDVLIRSHQCWVSQPAQFGTTAAFAQQLGRLSDLRDRRDCKTCQGIFGLLENVAASQEQQGQISCIIRRYTGRKTYHLTAEKDEGFVADFDYYMDYLPESQNWRTEMNLHPVWFDLDEIKQWADDCSRNHEDCCRRTSELPPVIGDMAKLDMVFIDAHDNCLRESNIQESFLALSYVWGESGAKLQLRLENKDNLRVPGVLKNHMDQIPRTIHDAILLTKGLGFRYLWVDQLCIVQDNPEDVSRLVPQMLKIYSSASITIVAADGRTSDHGLGGLPGGLPRRRGPYDVIEISPSQQFVTVRRGTFPKHYFTRGWTFNEYHFSRRLLIFIEATIIWKCEQNDSQESMSARYSLPIPLSAIYTLPYKYLSTSQGKLSWPDMRRYGHLILEYNQRRLTHDSDALAAFIGVIGAFDPYFQGGFLQGLPELYFDVALLWQPLGSSRRRVSEKSSDLMPSWSWVGWEGRLDLRMWNYGLPRPDNSWPWDTASTFPTTTWYKSLESAIAGPVVNNSYHEYYKLHPKWEDWATPRSEDWTAKKRLQIESSGLDSADWELEKWDSDTEERDLAEYHEPIRYHHTPTNMNFLYPIPMENSGPLQNSQPHFLHFRARRGYLHKGPVFTDVPMQNFPSNTYPEYPGIFLQDKHGDLAGMLRLHAIEAEETEEDGLLELVAISGGQGEFRLREDAKTWEYCGFMEELRHARYVKRVREACTNNHEPLISDEDADRSRLGDRTSFYEWYNVLWIEWIDGIAYRKACGRVIKQVWDAQGFEAIDVVLG
ncbi:HET-domain-containing protein [Lophiostoma macrostomum CBS 122681]|uniref:HET-domain-containing protein n=1 Tax=Lophiostoma macrostomum CBS 122681 TaxID=1314788 RepID=A0A6A6SLY0_9PLEO|nr:HET-domain-containing protein [Lophiostoma macrostomum CBS 122681]